MMEMAKANGKCRVIDSERERDSDRETEKEQNCKKNSFVSISS